MWLHSTKVVLFNVGLRIKKQGRTCIDEGQAQQIKAIVKYHQDADNELGWTPWIHRRSLVASYGVGVGGEGDGDWSYILAHIKLANQYEYEHDFRHDFRKKKLKRLLLISDQGGSNTNVI